MTEADRIFQQSLRQYPQMHKLAFRIPGIVRNAMDQYKLDNLAYPHKTLANLYVYLCNERLFNAYSSKFRAAKYEEEVEHGSIPSTYLSRFDVDPAYWKKVISASGQSVPINVNVPKIMVDFLNYMSYGLGVNSSPAEMYRDLTSKIIVSQLKPQLDYLLSQKQEKALREASKQQKLKL